MANYDGSITLRTNVDSSGIKQDAKKIANQYEAATQAVERQVKKVEELKKRLSGLESGEITVNDKGVAKLQTEFDKTTGSIEKTKAEISSLYQQLDQLQSNAFRAPDTGEVVLTGKEQAQFDSINAELDKLEAKLVTDKQKSAELGEALRNATGTATQSEIEGTKQKLAEAETKLDGLKIKADEAGQKLKSNMDNSSTALSQVSDGFGKMGTKLFQLAKGALVFSVITKGFTMLRQTVGSALMSNDSFRESVYMLQAALYTLAEPIYNAVLPALKVLIKWLIVAVLYVATFISGLSGKRLKESIKAAKELNKQSQAYQNISKSASKATKNTKKQTKAAKDLKKATKETNKELAEFDELLILQEKKVDDLNVPETSGGNGGINTGGIQSGFDGLADLLDNSDMENLQKFEDWVIDNKDAIKTGLEIAGLGILAVGIGKVIKEIGKLLGFFDKKDAGLDKQTRKTGEESEAVNELSKSFSLVPSLAYAIIPALNGVTDTGFALNPVLEELTSVAWGLVPAFGESTNSAYETVPAYDLSTDSAKQLIPAMNEATDSAYELVPAIDSARESATDFSPEVDLAKETVNGFDTRVKETMPSIETIIKTAFNNAKSNIGEFCTTAANNFYNWADNVQTNAINTAEVVATSLYNAFFSAGENIGTFINTTSSKFHDWANSVATNVTNAAKTIATNFGAALSSAWDNFKNFMSATGEKVSGFWSEHKAKIIGVTLVAGVVAGAIALAPYTGGVSLAAIPALAQGAVLPPNKPFLAMLGDQKSGTNIEAPLSTIKEAVRDVLSDGDYAGGNQTIILELDGREVGRTFGKVIRQENNRVGSSLIKTKLVFG